MCSSQYGEEEEKELFLETEPRPPPAAAPLPWMWAALSTQVTCTSGHVWHRMLLQSLKAKAQPLWPQAKFRFERGCVTHVSGRCKNSTRLPPPTYRQMEAGELRGLGINKILPFPPLPAGTEVVPQGQGGTCISWGWRGVPNGGGRADCLGAGEQQSVSRLVKCYPQPRKSGAKVSVNTLRNIFEFVSQCWKRSACAGSPFSIHNFLHCFPSPKAASLQSYVFKPRPQKPDIWEVWELNALEKFIF